MDLHWDIFKVGAGRYILVDLDKNQQIGDLFYSRSSAESHIKELKAKEYAETVTHDLGIRPPPPPPPQEVRIVDGDKETRVDSNKGTKQDAIRDS